MATDIKPRTPGGNRPPRQVQSVTRQAQPAKAKPRAGQPRPVSAPRHTRPTTPAQHSPQRTLSTQRTGGTQGTGRQQRMPFILLLVGLLGGALVSLLVISTTLDEGSYRISNLTQENATLANETHVLTQQVANAQNPGMIGQEAYQLGMRQDPHLRFINTKTGKISSSAPVIP
jgi:hypothetical protein